MPRKKHEWYIGAKLHVIARGNHRNDIFRDETDYQLYLNYLNEAIEYYKNKYQVTRKLPTSTPGGNRIFQVQALHRRYIYCSVFLLQKFVPLSNKIC